MTMHRAKGDDHPSPTTAERDELAAVLRLAWREWKDTRRNLHEFVAERVLEAGYSVKGEKR